MNQNEQKIRYFLYARKSSESEDKQVASIDAQINELTKMAKDSNLEIVDILQESKLMGLIVGSSVYTVLFYFSSRYLVFHKKN